MSPHPLDVCLLRVQRARQHFERLQSAFNVIPVQAKSITLASYFETDANKLIVTIATVPELPLEWSLDASECLFNLRVALDYLAWQLAVWNLQRQGKTRDPLFDTQYPIATSKQKLKGRQIQDLAPDHRAIIERAQPYGPDHMAQYANVIARGMKPEILAKQHVVAALGSLNNADKHRLLYPTAVSATVTRIGDFTTFDCEVANPNFFIQGPPPFQVGAKWADFDVVSVTGPDPRVEVPVDIEPTLAFGGAKLLLDYPNMERYVVTMIMAFHADLAP